LKNHSVSVEKVQVQEQANFGGLRRLFAQISADLREKVSLSPAKIMNTFF